MRVRTDSVSVYVVRPEASGPSHEFLQLRRVATARLGAGSFQNVRGGIDAGETAWQAALRELREEAGLRPAEFYRLGTIETFYIAQDDTLWHAVPFCALVSRSDKVVLNDEHDAVRWVPLRDAKHAFIWANEWPVIDEIERVILGNGPAKPHLRLDVEPGA
ncbi:MAG TPA: NUDIX domain-containing protein [Tepidisphaeraceae bacterium]|nr:NUDIX domain-containing protein [Tepidisphaeraceae bacterium]